MFLASENSRGQIASFLFCLATAPDSRLDVGVSEGLMEHISAAKPDYIRTGDGWPVGRPSSDVTISSILLLEEKNTNKQRNKPRTTTSPDLDLTQRHKLQLTQTVSLILFVISFFIVFL